MTNKFVYPIMFLLLLIHFYCIAQPDKSSEGIIQSGIVEIEGAITPYKGIFKTGKLTYFDAVTRSVNDKIFPLTTDGKFKLSFELIHPITGSIYFDIENNYYSDFYIEPGRSYEIIISHEKMKFIGTSGNTSNELIAFHDSLNYSLKEKIQDAEQLYTKGLPVSAYLARMKEHEIEKMDFLSEYQSHHFMSSKSFKTIENEIKYSTAHSWICYRKDYSQTDNVRDTLPNWFYSDLYKEYPVQSPEDIQTIECIDYISNIATVMLGDPGSFDNLISNISQLPGNIGRDLVISQALSRIYLNNSRNPSQSEWKRISVYLTDKSILSYIKSFSKEKSKKTDSLLDKSPIEAENTEKIKAKYISKYLGKVVYIDFYATWCGPCREDIPYAEALKQEFDGKDVVFLNLCAQSKKEDWENLIKQKNIRGENFLINREEYNFFSKLYNIKGFPTYILIDKNGNVASYNAARPSSRDILIQEIVKLLE